MTLELGGEIVQTTSEVDQSGLDFACSRLDVELDSVRLDGGQARLEEASELSPGEFQACARGLRREGVLECTLSCLRG